MPEGKIARAEERGGGGKSSCQVAARARLLLDFERDQLSLGTPAQGDSTASMDAQPPPTIDEDASEYSTLSR